MKYKVHYFDTLESTNEWAKTIAKDSKEGTVIVANKQTKGRGRLGRVWHDTQDKSILMSIILKAKLDTNDIQKIALIGAAAVNMALKDINIKSKIKWPNDVLVDNKKVCGILTEASSNFSGVNYIVLGIGINVNQDKKDIATDIKDKATSLKISTGEVIDKDKLLLNILDRFKEYYIPFRDNGDMEEVINICRTNSALKDKSILVIQGNQVKEGIARDINMDGQLLVEFPKGLECVYSGEVSIRGKNGYSM